MKAFLLTLFPFIVTSFVACTPSRRFPNLLPPPKTLGKQLDWLHEFSQLWEGNKEEYIKKLKHHFEIREVEELYATFCEDLDGLVEEAGRLRALVIKSNVAVHQEIPDDRKGEVLQHVAVVVTFLHAMHDELLHLLHDLEGHLHEGLKLTDGEVVALFERYGFTGEHLADVCVNDVKEKLKAFLAEGQPLEKIVKVHALGLTLRRPDTLGDELLWLHEFALAVAKNAALEAALLEQLNDVPTGKEVVEAVKELAVDDGVLHKVVVDKCCGDAFTCERAIRYTAFDEGQAGRYLGILRLTFMSVRLDILEEAVKIKAFCPFQAGQDFPVEFLESGEFTMDQVKCEPGKFVAVDGPLARIEYLLLGNRQQLIHDIVATFHVQ
ncbi:hypothetical protein BgAZ_404990 [Babesia gibsoni]|uniref:Uncharacterized protein n=1 Tax=Babesia gibsoni TaxID=33632 RepID=A0AAD8LHT5_BABGI|nr:hypothetical protein BgAZ_404990 [Babesia gibsoni]